VDPEGRGDVPTLINKVVGERAALSGRLLFSGVLLFRGWQVETIADFRRFVAAFAGTQALFDYAGGASPRSSLAGEGDVYTSTDYPPEVPLLLHNELSYSDIYPSRLYFFCLVPPESGGETTIGDSRRILAELEGEVAARFRRKQIRYVRTLSPWAGSGYSWQDAFGTSDRAQAAARCRDMGAEAEWSDDGFLRLSQVRPATARHPVSGEEVWFNQAVGFHPSALDPDSYRASLAEAGSEDRFRLNAYYGDGSPIDRTALDHVRKVLAEEAEPHSWRAGDILVLDNLLAAHGRRPFSGARSIAVAMS
jgi:hypothetical protein